MDQPKISHHDNAGQLPRITSHHVSTESHASVPRARFRVGYATSDGSLETVGFALSNIARHRP